MTRRATPSEMMWPDNLEANHFAIEWATGISTLVLDWMWRAFDALRANHLPRVDFSMQPEQLERDLTRNHFVEIQLLWRMESQGYASIIPVYEWPEMETRSPSPAKPPAYDFAFVSSENRRWAWPLEAKVVTSPQALAEYMKDVTEKFVGGVASPLIGEGAMIGYLVSCRPDSVFEGIASKLGQPLAAVVGLFDRPHRFSSHPRTRAPDIRLHHLLMSCN